MKKYILLLAIIFIAAFLRLFSLDQVPAGLDPDEAEFAFNSYTLSRYLKNENNQFLPYEVNTYGNYRPLLLPYLMAGSLKIFGNTVFAVRLPNALIGALTIMFFYFLVIKLTGQIKLASVAAWLLAVNPWHVFLSRGTAEPVVGMFFIILIFIALINYWQKQKETTLLLMYLFSFLAFFSYTGVLPLIFLLSGVLIFYLYQKSKKFYFPSLIPFIALIIFPLLPVYLNNPGYLNGRFKQTSFFTGMGRLGIQLVVDEQIRENGYNRRVYQNFITQIFHNVPLNTLNAVLNNWTKHFSFEYLYFKGGEPMRLQVPQTGIFLLVESIFLIGGAFLMARRKNNLLLSFGVLTILISFLPAGLTFEEVPSTHRPIFAVVGFLIIEAYFLTQVCRRYPTLILFLTAIFSLEFCYYLHNYLVLQPRHKNWWRHPEMQEVASVIKRNFNLYDEIYVVKNSTEPAYFYYFFNRLDPRPLILNSGKNHSASWSDGKVTYVHEQCADFQPQAGKKYLIIERSECENGGTFMREILSTDGTKILKVLKK